MGRFEPKTIDGDLVKALWTEIKNARDLALNWERQAKCQREGFDALLARMKAAGMSDWIPTLEEVQAAWRGDTANQ